MILIEPVGADDAPAPFVSDAAAAVEILAVIELTVVVMIEKQGFPRILYIKCLLSLLAEATHPCKNKIGYCWEMRMRIGPFPTFKSDKSHISGFVRLYLIDDY